MTRKNIPLILMLLAGGITCIITFVRDFPLVYRMLALLIVMFVFCFLGYVLKWILDYFEMQITKKEKEKEASEGEVIEKTSEEQEGNENPQKES